MNVSLPLSDLVGMNVARILRRLATIDTPVTGRRVGQLADVPAKSAARVLESLSVTGLVRREPAGRASLYSVNRDHLLWPAIESALNARGELLDRLTAVVGDSLGSSGTLAVYGSAARGDGDAHSDLDLLLVWPDGLDADQRGAIVERLQRYIAAATASEADILDLEESDLRRLVDAQDPLIDSLRADARTLAGVDVRLRLEPDVA